MVRAAGLCARLLEDWVGRDRRAEAVRRLDRSRAHRLEYLLLDGDHVGRRSAGVVRPVGEHFVHLVGVLGVHRPAHGAHLPRRHQHLAADHEHHLALAARDLLREVVDKVLRLAIV